MPSTSKKTEKAPSSPPSKDEAPAASSSAQSDDDLFAEVLRRFSLESLSPEEQLRQACLSLGEACHSNIRMQSQVSNLTEQLDKTGKKAETLEKLVTTLRTQVDLVRVEGDLRLKEETQRRIETSKAFEDAMTELSKLMEGSTGCNVKLREENVEMAKKMAQILADCEERERIMQQSKTEFELQSQLYEAQLAKAKIERAELTAEFTREKLELHKRIMEAKEENEALLGQTTEFRSQLDAYQKQCEDLQQGISGSTDHFGKFREEMDRLGRKLRAVEADTAEWRRRSESGAEQVRKMNAAAAEREEELQAALKRAEAMEKLNRALQKERAELMKKEG